MSQSSWDGVRKVKEDIERRKNSGGGGGGGSYFNLPKSGDTAVVRFIMDDTPLKWAWCHRVKAEGDSYAKFVVCLDQDENGEPTGDACPGCEAGGEVGKRKFRGWIAQIWRDAPVWARDENNNLVKGKDGKYIETGKEDRIAVWNQGIEVFENLRALDGHYHGLMSRDFLVTRKGEGMDTTYEIFPADPDGGPQPISEADEALIKENMPDLDRFTAKQSYEDWGSKKRSGGDDSSTSSTPAASSGGSKEGPNPFLKTKS